MGSSGGVQAGDGAALTTHAALETAAHGAVDGSSRIARIHTDAGTGENIYVDEKSDPSTADNVGDIRIVVPDGFYA